MSQPSSRRRLSWPAGLGCLFVAIAATFFGAHEADAKQAVISTVPAVENARVLFDGIELGRTDEDGIVVVDGVTPGRHTLRIFGGGMAGEAQFEADSSRLDVMVTVRMQPTTGADSSTMPRSLGTTGDRQTQSRTVEPRREALPQAARASDLNAGGTDLIVRGNVPGAEVWVDGLFLGITAGDGSLVASLTPGRHQLSFRKAGFSTVNMEVELQARRARAVTFEMEASNVGQTTGNDLALTVFAVAAVLAALAVAAALLYLHFEGRRAARSASGKMPTSIGRFTLKKAIGSGGMATVYLGRDGSARGDIALKVMLPGLLEDEDLVRKFLREGEILRLLNEKDPDAPVVKVFSFGVLNDRSGAPKPYIAMEYLEGESLLHRLKKAHRLRVAEAAKICAGVARALIPAHQNNIYHRDIDPQNVILVASPRGGYYLRLIDFGVARHEFTSHHTLDGSIAGKPPYMAPEQCRGDRVDGRADIYSLGILLYTLLVGQPPFVSRNPLEVMRMHQEVPVQLPTEFSPDLRRILETMLAKNPDHRFQAIEQVHRALEELVLREASS